jgi:hypothetical protein
MTSANFTKPNHMEFIPFPKIPRFNREVIVTEKIDGTNASIYIDSDGGFLTGSRKRWITPESDNFGFSRWAHANREELLQLGPGHHYGEWWGSGCQRGYGLPKGEKRFSLFNVSRWSENDLPKCVSLVPVLWQGLLEEMELHYILEMLAVGGSVAAPGFMDPEGIIIYHTAAGFTFKKTLVKDDAPKGVA